MGSPSAIISGGFGSWGSPSLIVTGGYGSAEAVSYPTELYFSAVGAYHPGFVAVESYRPGFTAVDEYAPGFRKVQGKELE